jgi:hypothetical protein
MYSWSHRSYLTQTAQPTDIHESCTDASTPASNTDHPPPHDCEAALHFTLHRVCVSLMLSLYQQYQQPPAHMRAAPGIACCHLATRPLILACLPKTIILHCVWQLYVSLGRLSKFWLTPMHVHLTCRSIDLRAPEHQPPDFTWVEALESGAKNLPGKGPRSRSEWVTDRGSQL